MKNKDDQKTSTQKARIPTQKEVADSLGISRGIVNRALHNQKGVSDDTRKTIVEKAKNLGYTPNRLASFLSTGRILNVAMITPADPLWKSVQEGAGMFSTVEDDHRGHRAVRHGGATGLVLHRLYQGIKRFRFAINPAMCRVRCISR